jgi:parallel beta-helix repeat protein
MKKVNVRKRLVFTLVFFMLSLLLISAKLANSQGQLETIFIRPDGTVNPSNVPIQNNGNIYTFTDDVYDPILVQKSNVTIDGAGYSLIGPLTEAERKSDPVLGTGPNTTLPPYIIGLDCEKNVSSITIKNLNVKNFNVGVYIRTTRNTFVDNSVSANTVGVLLSGSANKINRNYIFDNEEGLFFGFEQVNGSAANIPSDIDISENSFVNNTYQLSGCVCKVYNFSEALHSWDNGNRGNFWSDYNGTDANQDGIGDTYYRIDVLNQDRYPLMQSNVKPPVPVVKVPSDAIVLGVLVALVAAIVALAYMRRRKKTQGRLR